MSLHGLTSMTLGVPDVDAVASYYEDFGLRRVGDRPGRGLVLATAEGGEQLALRPSERRRLLEIGIGADDPDDLPMQFRSDKFFPFPLSVTETLLCLRNIPRHRQHEGHGVFGR